MSDPMTEQTPTPSRDEPNVCGVNRCGRPTGSGTHMRVEWVRWDTSEQMRVTVRVCEEHWQAVRDILPVEMPR